MVTSVDISEEGIKKKKDISTSKAFPPSYYLPHVRSDTHTPGDVPKEDLNTMTSNNGKQFFKYNAHYEL